MGDTAVFRVDGYRFPPPDIDWFLMIDLFPEIL
jgi:hypothetical protein